MKLNELLALLLCLTLCKTVTASTSDHEKLIRAEYPTDTLYKIWLQQQRDSAAALRFYEALTEKHLVELDPTDLQVATVTYFAKGHADTDYIMQSGGPDFYGLRFKRFGTTDLYYCVQKIPRDAWFTYGVNEFKRAPSVEVPALSHTTMTHIADGVVIGPNAPLSRLLQREPDVPRGSLRAMQIDSKAMGQARHIEVYLPADYNPAVANNLVLQFDGQNYAADASQRPAWEGWTPLPTILDNLIHQQKIAPTIAIFIHNQGNRSGDLLSDQMADFVALELVGWARANYKISENPKHIVASGPSRAGFAAANTAFRHANVVGSVLSQSGSFYYTLQAQENWPVYPQFEGKLLRDYKTAARDIQFYLDVGLYDLGLGAVGTNRQLRDVLELKGYSVDYYEYKGGHSHLGWRHTIERGLQALLGTSTTRQQ